MGDRKTPNTEFRDNPPVNMIARLKGVLGLPGYMRTYPGIKDYTLAWGKDRGGVYNERLDAHFRVSGDKFLIINADGTTTTIANLTGTTQAALPFSFNTQMLVDDGKAYLYDHENGFRKITDPDLGYPLDATWVDGYYFFTDGEYIFHTDLADESSITPLKYATAEFMPDSTLGVGLTSFNMVMVFGRYSIEYFSDIAQENFAFTRIAQKSHKVGIVATHAKCEINGRWYITGGGKKDALGVYRIVSGYPERVSTEAIDKILSVYPEESLSDMRMEAMYAHNHIFIFVHLPLHTLLFDETVYMASKGAHGWSLLRTVGFNHHRSINYIYDPRLHEWVCGDRDDDRLGVMRENDFHQYGEKQQLELYTPFVRLETGAVNGMEIYTVPGILTSPESSVAVSVSRDGRGFSSEWFETYGEPSEFGKRFIIRRLGYVRNYIGLKFRSVSGSPMAFSHLRIDVD